VCFAQVSWWIYFHLRESRRTVDATISFFEADRERAALRIEREYRASGLTGEERARAILAEDFPYLRLVPAGEAGERPPGVTPGRPPSANRAAGILGTVLPGRDLRVDEGYLSRLRDVARSRIVMFSSEGAFFMLLFLVGVFLIYGTLRQEVALKRQQSNFLSAVTHELKSPLASLQLYLQSLEMRRIPPEKEKKVLAEMLDDVNRLQALVENLLQAGRADRSDLAVHTQAIDLSAEIAAFADGIRESAAARGQALRASLDPGVRALADPEAVRLVFRNLVDNAVKYSRGPGEIRVRVRREGAFAALEVEDDGIGIPRTEQPRVFDKFYRTGDEMVRSVPGTGLGLYLAREMVEAQGGTIEVRSEGPGRGSLFRVLLPLDPWGRTGPAETAEERPGAGDAEAPPVDRARTKGAA
jgi:signal transduction histidine kinase